MNLKGLNKQDADFITGWFEGLAAVYNLNLAEMFLVRHSVARILCNEYRDQGRRKVGEGWWDPMPNTMQLSHIIDWLVADLQAGARWLENVDEQGRPRKLLKCKTFEDLEREANKAMDRRNGQQAKTLGPDDESLVADLGDGYTLVQMLTPEALDLESARMHHCIGHGAYDQRLKTGWSRFMSVRDRKRRPAATIELRRESNGRWSIRQIEGKRNERPPCEVMDVIRTHATKRNWRDLHYWWPVVDASDGGEYDIDRIPAGATVFSLDISQATVETVGRFELPPDLTVLGDASIVDGIEIPERLTVHGNLSLGDPYLQARKPFVLPESLHVDKEIRVWGRGEIVQPVPAHLHHRIRVALRKMTGYKWSDAEWSEEFHPIDEDDPEPGPGM